MLSAEDLSGLVFDQGLGTDTLHMAMADRIDLTARVLTHAAVCVKKFGGDGDDELEILAWQDISWSTVRRLIVVPRPTPRRRRKSSSGGWGFELTVLQA